MTLQDYCYESVRQGQRAAAEERMLPVAAQLFDVSTASNCNESVSVNRFCFASLSHVRP